MHGVRGAGRSVRAAKVVGGDAGRPDGDVEDDEDQDRGAHELEEEAAARVDDGREPDAAAVRVLADGQAEQAAADEAAGALRDHVQHSLDRIDVLGHCQRNGDRRVDVRAGDVSDGEGEDGDGKAEGERIVDGLHLRSGGGHGSGDRPGAEEDE